MACRRATRRTLPPSASTSASSAAFSCAAQIRRRALGLRISTSAKNASFWSPEGGSRDQQDRRQSPEPLHAAGRTLTEGDDDPMPVPSVRDRFRRWADAAGHGGKRKTTRLPGRDGCFVIFAAAAPA